MIRLHKSDPYFEEIFQLIQNSIPTGPQPVITPSLGSSPGLDEQNDFGIIVVSPEGPGTP